MYGINYPVSAIRTKLRQEFERNRYVNDMAVVDVLISQSHQEYQVRDVLLAPPCTRSHMRERERPVSLLDGEVHNGVINVPQEFHIQTSETHLTPSSRRTQETMNFWKQLSHVLKYFRAEEDPRARLPKDFISGFLEVRQKYTSVPSFPSPPYLWHDTLCANCS